LVEESSNQKGSWLIVESTDQKVSSGRGIHGPKRSSLVVESSKQRGIVLAVEFTDQKVCCWLWNSWTKRQLLLVEESPTKKAASLLLNPQTKRCVFGCGVNLSKCGQVGCEILQPKR
jgi:hypothetical protein